MPILKFYLRQRHALCTERFGHMYILWEQQEYAMGNNLKVSLLNGGRLDVVVLAASFKGQFVQDNREDALLASLGML